VAGVVRLTPAVGAAAALRRWIAEDVLPGLMGAPEILSAALWELDAEASRMPDTAETRLRGTLDAVVDWVLVVEASRLGALEAAAESVDAGAAGREGAARAGSLEPYRLLCGLTYDLAGSAEG